MSNALGVIQAHHSSMERHHALLLTIVDKPELRPYFYDRKPCPPDDPLRETLLTMAEMIADAAEYGLVATTIVPGSDRFGGWAGFPHFIWQQPIMREVISEYPEWFPTVAKILDVERAKAPPRIAALQAAGRIKPVVRSQRTKS